jgi:putative component of membrane protein insertase Oxa1/YidC/SpoIIIJ protein YidD
VAIAAVSGYQRFVSPFKGFGCAYRHCTRRSSCSAFAKRVFARRGVSGGLGLLLLRLQACAAAAATLAATNPNDPVLNEPCPLWSKEGAVCCLNATAGGCPCVPWWPVVARR